jgi:hypothetical protein
VALQKRHTDCVFQPSDLAVNCRGGQPKLFSRSGHGAKPTHSGKGAQLAQSDGVGAWHSIFLKGTIEFLNFLASPQHSWWRQR